MFKIAMQVRIKRKDVVGSRYVRDENGNLKVQKEEVIEWWRSYFTFLLHETNDYQLEEEDKVEGVLSSCDHRMLRYMSKHGRTGLLIKMWGGET